MMIGMNRSGKGDAVTMFEFMRIAPDGQGRLAFWASPRGREAVAFPLTSSGPNEAVFENAGHDFPVKVVYRRVGDRLIGTIYGPDDSNPISWEFRRR